MNKLKSIVPAFGIALYTTILPTIGSFVALGLVSWQLNWLNNQNIIIWSLMSILASMAMGLALIPSSLVILIGCWFNGFAYLVIYIPCYLLSAYLGIMVGRNIERGKLLAIVHTNPKARSFITKLNENGFWVVVLARLNPVLPFSLMNAMFAISGVKTRQYLFGSVLGMLPRTVLLALAATNAPELIKLIHTDSVPLGWFIALLFGSVLGMVYILSRFARN